MDKQRQEYGSPLPTVSESFIKALSWVFEITEDRLCLSEAECRQISTARGADARLWWKEKRRHTAAEHPYFSSSGYPGTQHFEYTYYGAPDGMSDDGLRNTSEYIKELTREKWGEKQIKNFLTTVNPLECGRYICGIKITDRSSYNNGGAGGGSKQMILYDKAAIYDGMIGSGLIPRN